MKNFYTLVAAVLFGMVNAQVPNNGFEQTLEDGFTLRSWGTFFPTTVSVGIDGTEVIQETNIFFDNGFGFSMPVGDCLTGSWAMQLSNAFDLNQNTVIPGKVSLFNEEIAPTATGWNRGIPLPEGSAVQFLGFDYKFFPMGNDVALARLEIFNDDGQSIGVAEITMTETVSDFQYVYVPITFTQFGQTPKFMTIDFSMQKDNSEVNSWSTLIVDNVVVNWEMLGVDQQKKSAFMLYPTLADDHINIIANDEITGATKISVADSNGKLLRSQTSMLSGDATAIDVSYLAHGMYLLIAESAKGRNVTRFIKK